MESADATVPPTRLYQCAVRLNFSFGRLGLARRGGNLLLESTSGIIRSPSSLSTVTPERCQRRRNLRGVSPRPALEKPGPAFRPHLRFASQMVSVSAIS